MLRSNASVRIHAQGNLVACCCDTPPCVTTAAQAALYIQANTAASGCTVNPRQQQAAVIDGTLATFDYASPIWTDNTVLSTNTEVCLVRMGGWLLRSARTLPPAAARSRHGRALSADASKTCPQLKTSSWFTPYIAVRLDLTANGVTRCAHAAQRQRRREARLAADAELRRHVDECRRIVAAGGFRCREQQ